MNERTMGRAPGEAGLVRALGTWGLAASIVNITIGGGIFRAPGSPEVTGRLGAAAPLAYLVCAIAMAFVVLCFAEAGRRVALTGGPYAYVERAFGRFAGFLVGWQLWLVGTIATAAVATIFADSALRLFPSLPPVPGRAMLLGAMFAIVSVINVLGVQFGARMNMASTIAKLLPLAILIVLGLANAKGENFAGMAMPAVSDLGRASIVVLFVFAGLESALVPSGEVRDPARTVPRAVFIGLAIVTVVYILVQVAAQGVIGDSLAGRTAPLADLGEAVMGPFGAAMIGVAVVLSTFGYLCGMILAIPRALFAFARDGFLPGALAAVHPRFHTPWLAIILQTILALALALTAVWEQLVIFANVAVLFVYLGCAAAAWQLRRAGVSDDVSAPPRIPGSALGPPLATVVIIALLTAVTAKEWVWIGGATAVGLLVYWFSQLRRKELAGAG